MSLSKSLLRNLLVDSPTSFGAKARLRRWEMFVDFFPDVRDMHVVDLGGTVDSWERSPVRPKSVTVLNLRHPRLSVGDWLTPVDGDACDAAAVLSGIGLRNSFDLVYSNSLIEHLGGHARRMEFAEQVKGLGPEHWIQTPYRYFPIEPHWLFPGMQFLPVSVRTRIACRWPLVHTRPPGESAARSEVLWTELLGKTEMAHYFPESTILSEKIFGLTKSIVSVKTITSS